MFASSKIGSGCGKLFLWTTGSFHGRFQAMEPFPMLTSSMELTLRTYRYRGSILRGLHTAKRHGSRFTP